MTTLRRLAALFGSLVVSTFSATAFSQQAKGFALDRFEPSVPGSEWFSLESLDLRGSGRPSFGVVGDWSHKPLVLYAPDGSEKNLLVSDQIFVHLGAGIILANRLRLSASLPIAVHQEGDQVALGATTFVAPSSTSIGDVRLGADVRLAGEFGDAFTLAFGLQAHLPTGHQSDYTGDGKVRLVPQLLGAGEIGPFVYAVKLGAQYRALDETFAGGSIGSEALFGAAAGVRTAARKLILGPELYGSSVITSSDSLFKKRSTPVELIVGGHYTFADDFRLGAGIGPGLTRAFGTPQLRVLASLEWIPAIVPPPAPSDRDKDGVLDVDDACPDTPGVKTDDPATNGCPPPAPDRDKDGIADADDACPDTPGVKTNDPKTNGCPPPAPDRDKDGIADADDACPDTPGVKTNDPKTNGCPPPAPDRDKDGIPDPEDACPDVAGPKNEDPKKNGCPEAHIEAGEIKILQQVKFKTNSAEILPASDVTLSAVFAILKEHPDIVAVRIEGHTDSRGGAQMNMGLSARRAASVVKWLVAHGVDKDRLVSKGFGLTRPIDSNETDDGRQNNRRVEFHIETVGETNAPEGAKVK
jgi:outer membrane protein OmpA-like peptidoglycan-associated protein